MSTYIGDIAFEHGRPTKVGVLICNLGTPTAPTTGAVRAYLREFLSDPRVIELPRPFWLPLLYGVILPFRPRRSAAAYQKIWTDDGSPLAVISERQQREIVKTLEARYPGRITVALGMRYGEPSIQSALEILREANSRTIVVLPLYPQYAAATTASVFDAVSHALSRWRWVPSMRFVNDYHDDERYIEALVGSVNRHWENSGRGEHLLMSFHGTPQETFLAGDPYHCQCQATARLLAEKLGLDSDEWSVSFQSRFGPKAWLQPYTEARLLEFAQGEAKTVDVICPGFAADCLETLEEIAMQYGSSFKRAGGKDLKYIPALNDDAQHIDALVGIIERQLAGLPQTADDWDDAKDERSRKNAAERADSLKRSSNL